VAMDGEQGHASSLGRSSRSGEWRRGHGT
jgi:hypothetical protein